MSKFPGCQLAHEWTGWPKGRTAEYLVEPKLDGYRLSVVADENGEITFHCRDEKQPDWAENLGHIADAIRALKMKCIMLDGEIMGSNWNETSKLVRRKRSKMSDEIKARIVAEIKFHVFDAIRIDEITEKVLPRYRKPARVFNEPLYKRRYWLQTVILADNEPGSALMLAPQFVVKSDDELQQVFQEMIDLDFEGVMVKDPEAPYVLDRSYAWLKIKPFKTIELTIKDSEVGEGKCAGVLGAFVCVAKDGTQIRVGGGFTDEMRRDFWARRDQLVGMEIEVKVQDGNVATARHPNFLRFRNDRNAVAV